MAEHDLTITYKGGLLGAVGFAGALEREGLHVEFERAFEQRGVSSVDVVIVLVLNVVLDAAKDARNAIRAKVGRVITRFRERLPDAEIRLGDIDEGPGYL
jgi:hypothetical protein